MSLTGTWKTRYGTLRLVEKEGLVFGIYRDVGVIEGRRSGGIVKGTFLNKGKAGRFIWSILDGDEEFFGRWAWGAEGALMAPELADIAEDDGWAGSKTSETITIGAAARAPWQGEWDSTYGPLLLVQKDDRVMGLYADKGVIEGRVAGQAFSGRFTNKTAAGDCAFKLDANGVSFEGQWRWSGAETTEGWSGQKRGVARASTGVRSKTGDDC